VNGASLDLPVSNRYGIGSIFGTAFAEPVMSQSQEMKHVSSWSQKMRLCELARKIGARILTHSRPIDVEVDQFYADDRISELLAEARCERTLVVSNILNPHIFRVAGLLDVPAICLLNNYIPEEEMLNASAENGAILMISPVDLFETSQRLCHCLGPEARVSHENRA